MPRLSKSKTTDSVDTPAVVSVPVVAAPVSDASVKVADASVKVKKVKEPKAAKTESSAPVVSVPVVAAPVVDESAPVEDVEASIAAQSVEFMAKLNQLSSMIASLKTEYRTLEKKWSREIKAAQKQSSKRKRKAGNRAPSGFVKPTKISDELASFLGKEKGTEMARTDVTREINTYIRAHKLQDKDNGRKIIPDTKLATLLKLKKTDELTYFNLQKYMSPHFAKAVKAEVATA
jgi:upstream activation factor subunit UAF30